MPYLFFILLSK